MAYGGQHRQQQVQVQHGSSTPTPSGMLPFQLPSINVGGSSAPGGVAVEILAGGVAIGKVELYNLHQPLPSSAPRSSYHHPNSNPYATPGYGPALGGGEPLGRPTPEMIQRRRSASVMSMSNAGGPAGRPPLIDRIQSPRNSNVSSPMPGLSRSDITYSSDGGDNFAIPQSRPHSRMSNNGTAGGHGGGWGGPPQNNGYHPYRNNGPPQQRPFSSNSNRSYQSGCSNGSQRTKRDSYYPRYVNKTPAGEYAALPEDRKKPWFTPLPEEGQFTGAALLVEGLEKGTMPSDMMLVAKEYGTVEFVEVLEEKQDSYSMILAFATKGECDYCVQKLDGVTADGKVLRVAHTKLEALHRPYMMSTDHSHRVTRDDLPRDRRSTSILSSDAGVGATAASAAANPMAPIQEQREETVESDIQLD